MISRVRGALLSREEERVEVATTGGVVYEVEVPLTVAERLPRVGGEVELRTVLVVREDAQELYGFLAEGERALFRVLIDTSGLGAKLALKMLSTFSAGRLSRVLVDRNVGALTQVTGIGKKKAERFVLELSDRVKKLELDLDLGPGAEGAAGSAEGPQAAVQGLIALGLTADEAERAVRAVLAEGAPDDPDDPDDLIRRALARR